MRAKPFFVLNILPAGDHKMNNEDKTEDLPVVPINPESVLQFFAYHHLPEASQKISKPFGEMAQWIVENLPRNPQRTIALNNLLLSKDAAVRTNIFKNS